MSLGPIAFLSPWLLAGLLATGCSPGALTPGAPQQGSSSSAGISYPDGPPLGPAGPSPVTLAGYDAQKLRWRPCNHGFQCTRLLVPFDYQRPGWRRFSLPVIRLPATSPRTRIGSLVVNPGGTVYGAGANPLGVQGNIGNRRIQPFASGSLGFLYFTRQVPVVGSSQFNYNITIGFGMQFLLRSKRSVSVGWKYHHLSNNYQARLNPGIDSGVFYASFSLVRGKR